eukprot:Plantae.Rhodophyta-Rhodochaete_pulchella.ctg245.p1 GENE.Plantae.Rhodophyta-Rhodochaete_pulchella.ctg245~~Plantae.Rhodophyta-Rhodochaete_pulchella.ctg245.p1  ORF type:complete len:160 (+),score=31.25 Plantae.Rhodophyta-Rhodochaete_pulchella.ctg245:51-482(+)
MEAMLGLEIEATSEALGSLHSVISKRRGRATSEDLKEGSSLFTINALLPVTESFGFAETLRMQTSGGAQPQMTFSHWETLSQDPFWTPSTPEELEDLGREDDTQASNNLAAKLIRKTRRRKGLYVNDQVVERAEKQRTLNRKK